MGETVVCGEVGGKLACAHGDVVEDAETTAILHICWVRLH